MEKNPEFLKKKYNLHNTEEVKKASERTQKTKEEKVSQKPQEQIQNYLDRFNEILQREDTDKKQRGIDAFKKISHDKFVIKPENIPYRAFELEQDIAEQQGHGRPEITQEFKERKIDEIIGTQEKSLDRWTDYLSSEDAMYPDWIKYWAFRSMLEMGKFNKGKEKFEKRTKDTVAPFPPLNPRALAQVSDLMQKKAKKEDLEIEDEEFQKLLQTENFAKIYAYVLKNLPEFSEKGLENIEGEWVKYEQGSDHMPLVESLEGYPLEWCTAGEDVAKTQLEGGDFYVYYSKDSEGNNKIPRLAIRMNGKNEIGEIRGIEKDQNIDQYIQPVLDEKLEEFGSEGEAYKTKSADMKRMTEITQKYRDGQELTREDLRFVYEVDKPIEGFGYGKDPRIKEVIDDRDIRSDLVFVLDVQPEEISLTREEALSGNIKFHYGDLDLSGLNSAEGLKLPETVNGYLDLSGLTSAEGVKLPETVNGDLYLRSLTSAEGLKLPEILNGDLDLRGLTSAEGLKLPETVNGDLDLRGLTSAEGLKLPETVNGGLYLGGLTSAEGLKLPETLNGYLDLSGLTSAEGLELPETVNGYLYLNGLTSAEGLKLPETVNGYLNLNGLTSAEGLKLPETVNGDLYLNNLTSAEKEKLRQKYPQHANKIL